MLGAGEGESGGAKEKVAFPLVLEKRVLFILVSKKSWQDRRKGMNLLSFNRKLFILGSFILFYDVILHYKIWKWNSPWGVKNTTSLYFYWKLRPTYINENLWGEKNWMIWEASCKGACLLQTTNINRGSWEFKLGSLIQLCCLLSPTTAT